MRFRASPVRVWLPIVPVSGRRAPVILAIDGIRLRASSGPPPPGPGDRTAPGPVPAREPGVETAPGRPLPDEEAIAIRDAGAEWSAPPAGPDLPELPELPA